MFHSSDGRRVLVIANPTAGRQRRLAAGLAPLAAAGWRLDLVETRGPGDAERLAAEGSDADFDIVLAAGGDGTVNEIVNGLSKSPSTRRPSVGVLPLGTANVLARELGLPLGVAAAAKALISARPRRSHLGLVQGRLFVMMAGVGFDARVVSAVRPDDKRRFGRLAYVATAARLWLEGRENRYRIRFGNETAEVGSLVVANGRHYAGGFVACPDACLGRPDLGLCLVRSASRASLLAAALGLGLGRIAWAPGIRHLNSVSIHVEGSSDDPVQADGDIVGHLPAVFSVAAETIDFLTPIPSPSATRRSRNVPETRDIYG